MIISLVDHLSTTPPKRQKNNFKSVGTKDTLGLMKNRRIQTTMMVGATQGNPLNLHGTKFEIIHKDIGYSSDADMSDVCEVIKLLVTIILVPSPC